ncbi:MAG TPA: acetyl-CoA carboxylase biotin carboxylase subunit [Acidiphilium sp.]|nr:MAG: acetyl-CoA carboxylase biotin carboxylase subunit [Acidiphilium sp. 21-60-14]OYV90844.1 MAG: acetyl-CoA carboxylase biotin carboxylase subunit [Acidiphilium sp. 37-60-79]HQT86946.1 acetyl-CoA carboxylase biotin carboxylase subunit [Acidiphilium sp.]HQU24088.1 acetyl-CoA carboxylase biotin carboxylase subunit [Acidiphilium sp.]
MIRVFIANRGEIALRAVRVCRTLGLETVAGYTPPDAALPHVWAADHSVCIGPPAAAQSYLNGPGLITAALASGCDAVYPGYGFLSENAEFAEQCRTAGLTFIGPSPEIITLMGDKAQARRTAAALGMPIVPGSEHGFAAVEPAQVAAEQIGFPILLKASAGGGGRGMRIAEDIGSFATCFMQASAEAKAAFGNAEIYLERFFRNVRHVEVQIFADQHGNVVHLWERDCSVQRRHQKLIEEAPSPILPAARRLEITQAAEALARGLGYEGAGTVEFIYDPESDRAYFIEMNTRIQVEHPVTEMLTGTDLVAEQFRVAAGAPLSISQPGEPHGVAIEFRINAEDAYDGFRPAPGLISAWKPPRGEGIRVDSHVYPGWRVSPYYDSLLGKLIIRKPSRTEAIAAAQEAIARFEVRGVPTTLPFHADLLTTEAFRTAAIHTRWIEQDMAR